MIEMDLEKRAGKSTKTSGHCLITNQKKTEVSQLLALSSRLACNSLIIEHSKTWKRHPNKDEKQNITLRRHPIADILESGARTHDVGPRHGLGLDNFNHIEY